MDRERELASKIIEVFENLLEEKGIKIPSKDREGNEEEASIFGREYYRLEDEITSILKGSKELDTYF